MSKLRSLIDPKTKVITSPTLPGSSKKALLSPSEETSWTSAASPSFIHLSFPSPLNHATHFAITFQGGFSPNSVMVYVAMAPKEGSSEIELGLMMARRVFPEDKSVRQVFEIPYPSNALIPPHSSPLPQTFTSTEDLTIETERPPNPEGRMSPAPMHDSAKNRLPVGYQSISSTLDVSKSASGPGNNGTNAVNGSSEKGRSGMTNGGESNDSSVVRDRLSSGWTVPRLTEIKFEFEKSSDNQGRVTVYAIEVLGS